MEKDEDIQGCVYSIDYGNYDVSLGKKSLNEIKSGRKVRTEIYHGSYLLKGKKDIKERMRKELVLGLLSDSEYSEKNKDVVVRPYKTESNRVIMDVSQTLLYNLLHCEGNGVGYCYNDRGNKITFYAEDSSDRGGLDERMKLLKKLYAKE